MLNNIKGEVEITGIRNGKIIYYDKGENTVTTWAKHSVIHLLTGKIFSNSGESFLDGVHSDTENSDGALISGKQFLNSSGIEYWANDASIDTGFNYTFFPTKIILGTGTEFEEVTDSTEYSALKENNPTLKFDDWTTFSDFNTNINDVKNNFSNTYSEASMLNTRTVNSITTTSLTAPQNPELETSVKGVIKTLQTDNTAPTGSLIGVGKPCFVYVGRENAVLTDTSEALPTSDNNEYNNKITFTVVLPDQTGDNSGKYYPYNGYTIKEAGLFADALVNPNVELPAGDLNIKMPYGLLFAKRYITPFTKTADSSFTIRWTIYI